jgi:uncharacterized coiled-coil protein SlyX
MMFEGMVENQGKSTALLMRFALSASVLAVSSATGGGIDVLRAGQGSVFSKAAVEAPELRSAKELDLERDIRRVQEYLGKTESLAIGRVSREYAKKRILENPDLPSLAEKLMVTGGRESNIEYVVAQPGEVALGMERPLFSAGMRTINSDGGLYALTSWDNDPSFNDHVAVYGGIYTDYGDSNQVGVWGRASAPNTIGVVATNDTDEATRGVALHATGTHQSQDDSQPNNHAAIIENSASNWPAVMALYMSGEIQSELTTFDNFITFIVRNDADTADIAVGSIDGNGSGGVRFNTSGADIAEYIEKLDHEEVIEEADIVGVVNGKITKQLDGAHSIQVISSGAAVAGSSPGEGRNLEHEFGLVAFIGQVPVKVMGKVNAGDYIIASGKNDGKGIAVPADEMTPEFFRLMVGRAWESSSEEAEKRVNTVVGLAANDAYAYMQKQDQRIASLEQQLSGRMERLDRLAAQMALLTQRVAYIQSAKMTAKADVK